MFDFYEKRKVKQLMYSKVSLVILAIVVILLLNSVWNIFRKEAETRINRAKLENSLEELKERESVLREEIERLSTERGIEEEVRSKFEVAREDEEVMVIVDPTPEKDADTQKTKESFLTKFFTFFKRD